MTLADRLRRERELRKLTQRELATIGNVQANAQGHYESGLRIPRADYLSLIANAGLDVHFIVTGERMPLDGFGLSKTEEAVIKSFRVLQSEDREALERVMETLTSYLDLRPHELV